MHSHRNMPYPLFPTKRTGTAQSFSSVRPRCLRSCYATCGVPVGKSSAWSIAEAGLLVCHANTWFTVTGCALKALLPVPALQGWESFPSLAVPARPSCCLRSEHPECFRTKSCSENLWRAGWWHSTLLWPRASWQGCLDLPRREHPG